MALAALKAGRPGAARAALEDALEGVGLDDGREAARIIAKQYRALQSYDETPTVPPMTETERDDADETYRRKPDEA